MAEAASAAAGGAANLAIQEVSFLCGVHDEVESLRDDLRSMQTFLSVEAQRGGGGNAVTADSVRRVRHAVYEAENIIDDADYRAKRNSRRKGMLGAISRYARKPMDLVARHKLGKDVLQWRRKIQDIKFSREFLDAINADRLVTASTPQPSTHRACLSRLAADPDNEAALVGLKGDVERIEEWLKDEDNTQVTVISIVAMGGAGKTTLARKVYNSAAAKEHFDVFAFVSISQQFEVLPVLKEIAMQAMGINKRVREFDKIGQGHELENMGEQELAGTLRSFLEMKRYLIVLDDVWRMDTWENIQHAFPDQGNGSRLMLTTRYTQVAKQVNKLTHLHQLGLLNEKESEKLFFLKAFPSYENIDAKNRQELESVGRNLAEKCHGLPLALVVLGSHLSKNLCLNTWSKMERCLDWEVTSKWDNMQRIIALSYDDLPSDFLKNCFLCIASFPEDFTIGADELRRYWIGEGFLQHKPNQTLEDIAHDCLEELVQRSMVHTVSWNFIHGRISTVQMHDMVREWAIRKAREDEYLKVCRSRDDVSGGAYRLSFIDYFDDRIFISSPNMRSMLGFNLPRVTFGTQRFLRALYMWDTNLENISKVLGHLIHLRYIGLITCKNVVLPSSIGKLLNLQTIILTGTRIPHVPKSLWDISTLRHVDIPDLDASFDLTTIRAEEQSELHSLLIASEWTSAINKLTTDSPRWIGLEKYLVRMAQLRTLSLKGTTDSLPVDVLISLKEHRHLESLYLTVWESSAAFPESSKLPQNLGHLILFFRGSTWNSWHADLLPTLGRLQSLVDLTLAATYQPDDAEDPDGQLTSECCQKVGVTTYKAPIMSSPAGAFPRLRHLRLYGVQVHKLRFQTGTMPKLVQLTFGFGHMTTVPDGLFDLPSLEKLNLHIMENVLPREIHELVEGKGIKVIVTGEDN
ncbi:hypothetical protein PR202_gb01111 [Eleusine coracana subsp. coracana]|uniref:Uncharacterized protein n=1 Tax=Eleusine coracana subsp. coracana TaxID=191504 RepID=A0AAV5DVS8_ELECO|nr:hypothetical protein PR202_gb01111 [Eleusine coracana subsp. coracana]